MKVYPRVVPLLFLVGAAGIALSLFLPLWRVLLYFPQYPEGPLRVVAHVNRLTGDLAEIDILNQYIGVSLPKEVPEFAVLPGLLVGVATLTTVAAFVRGRVGIWVKSLAPLSLLGVLIYGMLRINTYLATFGTTLDPEAALSGVVKPFKPPLWGEVKIIQVRAVASFQAGAYLLGLAMLALAVGTFLVWSQGRPAPSNQNQE